MLKSEEQKTFICKLFVLLTFKGSLFRFCCMQSGMSDCVQPGDQFNRMRLPLNLNLNMLILAY